jgi:hypothetical protein
MADAVEGRADNGTGSTGSNNANTEPWRRYAVHRASSCLGDLPAAVVRQRRRSIQA